MQAETTILSRVEGSAAVAALSNRNTGALLAEAEEMLGEHLRRCGLRHVRRMVELSRAEMLCQPHFTARAGDVPVDVYVLSIGNMDSPSGLSDEQCRYCEQQQGRAVYALPCLVQRLRNEVARCAALPLVELRRDGNWHRTAEVLQYLPLRYAHAAEIPMPCSAWLLKKNNALREVANNGTRLYPLVERFAHAGHLPAETEIRGSATQSPLLLTLAGGRDGGRLQLLYGDFYSADNAVNELAVKEVPYSEVNPLVRLASADGHEFSAICAEVAMFPEHKWQGLHFLWALSMLCHRLTRLPSGTPQPGGYEGGRLCAEVRSARRCSLCGLPLCHLEAVAGKQVFNIYTAVYDADAVFPGPGDVVCAEGVLYAVPDALVPKKEPQPAALHEELLPVSAALAVVAGGLMAAGFTMEAPFKPLFRCGVPELRLLSPEGEKLWVLVDTVVNGTADSHGYFRYAPASYPERVNGKADVLFASVSLASTGDGGYRTSVALHGHVPEGLSFCDVVRMKPVEALPEVTAARIFGEMMVTHDFTTLLPLLMEDVCYRSDTAGLHLLGKFDLLRHLRACFDNWQRRGECANLSFLLSGVEVQGTRRPCVVACQLGEIISATVFEVAEGRIVSVESLAGDVLDTIQPLSSEES